MLILDKEQDKFCFLVLAVLELKLHFSLVLSAMSLGQPTAAIAVDFSVLCPGIPKPNPSPCFRDFRHTDYPSLISYLLGVDHGYYFTITV